MSRQSFEQYGRRAKELADPIEATARLPTQVDQEDLVVQDVATKLDLRRSDRLLDIGAGIGDITIPLSFKVKEIVAVDHEDVLARLKRRAPDEAIKGIPGNWLEIELLEMFDKVLAYSVIHYLSDFEEVSLFIDKAIQRLLPRGRLLIGDIPSAGLRGRFDGSMYGRKFNTNWNKVLQAKLDEIGVGMTKEQVDHHNELFERDPTLVKFHDTELYRIVMGLRASGYQAWLLPQHEGLPFGTQREDLLVMRP